MRKLYQPHFRGAGDGLVFHFLFGFEGMSSSDQRLVSEELPLIMDDIAELIQHGYTVVLDTEGTLGKLRQALYSEVADVPRLRTAGVMWSSSGKPDGTLGTWDGATVQPADVRAHKVDRLLRMMILSAPYAGQMIDGWMAACGAECHVFAWDDDIGRGSKLEFLNARAGDRLGLHDLIRVHLLRQETSPAPAASAPATSPPVKPAPAQAPPPGLTDDGRTVALPAVVAVAGVAAARAPREVAAPGTAEDEAPVEPTALAVADPSPTDDSPAPAESTPDPAEAPKQDPIGNIANSVFSAFSGGKSFDQVVGEQLKRHKLLGGVAATVLPGLVSYAGGKAATRINDTGARNVIKSATDAASKALSQNPDEEAAEAARAAAAAKAATAAPQPTGAPQLAEAAVQSPVVLVAPTLAEVEVHLPNDSDAPTSPRELEHRLRQVAEDLRASSSWQGKTLTMDVPLGDRHQVVYARLLPDGPTTCLSLYCHVGYKQEETDLAHALRLAAQTWFARVSLVAGDQGDTLLCQTTLPRTSLTRDVLRLAVQELAGLADGLEGALFGADHY